MKLFSRIIVFAICVFSSVSTALASMPTVYPTYGYNPDGVICQIKQSSEGSEIREELIGEYWSLRECRRSHLDVFLNTGFGILVWLGIVVMAFVLNFMIYPRFEKRTRSEQKTAFMFDLTVLGLFVFFIILFQHYFEVPYVYYNYGSDFDEILYSDFIHSNFPSLLAALYGVFSITKIILLWRKLRR